MNTMLVNGRAKIVKNLLTLIASIANIAYHHIFLIFVSCESKFKTDFDFFFLTTDNVKMGCVDRSHMPTKLTSPSRGREASPHDLFSTWLIFFQRKSS